MPHAGTIPVPSARDAPRRALRLHRAPDGRMFADSGGSLVAVRVRQCFPWSSPQHFLSLRDEDDTEVALIADPVELDEASRAALEAALAAAGFVFAITRVLSIEEEVEIRHWRVLTRQGQRQFQTHLDEWPRLLPDGSRLIRDVSGDLYQLMEPERMDRRSRALLWAFID